MLENKKNVLLLFSCIIAAKSYQVNAEGDSQNKNTGKNFHKTGTIWSFYSDKVDERLFSWARHIIYSLYTLVVYFLSLSIIDILDGKDLSPSRMELKTIIGEAEKMVKNKGRNKGYTTQKDTTTTNPPRQSRTTQHLNETSKGLLELE